MKADPDTLAALQFLESKVNDVLARTGAGGSGGIFYEQGGNAFGAQGTLGLTDNNTLQVIANNQVKLQLGDSTHGIAIGVPPAVSLGAANTISLGCTGHLLGVSTAAIDFQGGAASSFTTTAGTVTITGAGGFSINGGAGSTISTSVGAIGIAPVGALTLTGGAASVWSTSAGGLSITGATSLGMTASAGAITVDASAAANFGSSTATSVVVGNTTNATNLLLTAQTLTVTVPAGQIATTASAIGGGAAAPATLNFLICTINGTARKILFAAT